VPGHPELIKETDDVQFLVMGYDGDDEAAPDRRQAARPQHLARADELMESGRLLYAAALLDDDERMVGSAMVLDYPTRAELDAWLESEPYVTGDVWRRVEVTACRPGPRFQR
jgi:uncharacterized protein